MSNDDDDDDDDADELDSEDCLLPELSIDQLLGSASLSSMKGYLGRRRLEPLPEEEDSSGSDKHQVGWWWQRFPKATSQIVDSTIEERGRNFARLTQEDEEFRRKILDLHRKLSDVDEDAITSRRTNEIERLRELEMVAKRAEETFDKNSIEVARERIRESHHSEPMPGPSLEKQLRFNVDCDKKKSDDDSEDKEDKSGSTFLKSLRIRRRSVKLLSFLSGKTCDKAQEERANRLLRMYATDKGSKGPNTISIHHTSRDKRFWRLRNRRRSSSAWEKKNFSSLPSFFSTF